MSPALVQEYLGKIYELAKGVEPMFVLFLNLFQGILAGAVFLAWRQGWAVTVAYICFGINSVMSVLVTKLEWGEDPKGKVRELVELAVQLGTVLFGAVYMGNEYGKGFLSSDTPALFGLIGLAVFIVNFGPVISWVCRMVANILDVVSGYQIEDIVGGGFGGGE